MFLPFFKLDLGRVSAMHACLPFAFEETEEKPIVVVVTPLTAIIFIAQVQVLDNARPFPSRAVCKGRATPD